MTGLGFNRDRKTGLVLAGERRDSTVRPLDGPPIFHKTGIGPWGASVRVEAWETRLGNTYRVITRWLGPPVIGAAKCTERVQAVDFHDIDDQALAVRVARAAADLLGRPERPDLQTLAARL